MTDIFVGQLFDIVPQDSFLPQLSLLLMETQSQVCRRCPAPCLLCIQHGYFPLFPQPVPNQGCYTVMRCQSKAKLRSCWMDMGNNFCRHCSQHRLRQKQPWEQMKVLIQQMRRKGEKEILLFLSLFLMCRSKLTRRPKCFTPSSYTRG